LTRPAHTADSRPVYLAQPTASSAASAGHDVRRLAALIPPLGLLSIAAYLEERGLETRVFDFNAFPDDLGAFRQAVAQERPTFLGITCVTATFNAGLRIARAAREILPQIRVVLGGPHASSLREKVLAEYEDIDFCVVGEGEETFCRLVSGGLNAPESLAGIVFRDENGAPRFTGYPVETLELDDLPYPAYERLRGFPEKYRLPIFSYPRPPGMSIVSSRGCPYACSYCDRSVFRRSFRYNSAAYLYNHMRFLKEKYDIRHLIFYDDQFTFNRERVAELCHRLIEEPLGLTFNCAVRAEHVDAELLALMKRAGCWMISLGIETGDPDLLARHRSNADLDMLARCIRHIKRAGIRVKGLLMMGLPGESAASIRRSMKYVRSLPIDEFNLAKFTPFHGLPLYEKLNELGRFDEDWDRMDCMNFQFIPKGLTRESLDKSFLEFYKAHFTRPAVWWNYVTMVWKSPDSWRRFFLNLGDFLRFALKGELTQSHGQPSESATPDSRPEKGQTGGCRA